MNQLIVFVFPSTINFGAGSGGGGGSGRTKTVWLYNPYDFSLKFNFLSTNPNAFSLSAANGLIRSRHLVDIVIRVKTERLDRTEQFLIAIKEHDSPNPRTGERVLPVTNNPDKTPDEGQQHRFVRIRDGQTQPQTELACRRLHGTGDAGVVDAQHSSSGLVMTYAIAIICQLSSSSDTLLLHPI